MAKGQHRLGTYLCIMATDSRVFTWSQPNVKEKRRASSLMLLKEAEEVSVLPLSWLSTCFWNSCKPQTWHTIFQAIKKPQEDIPVIQLVNPLNRMLLSIPLSSNLVIYFKNPTKLNKHLNTAAGNQWEGRSEYIQNTIKTQTRQNSQLLQGQDTLLVPP